MYSSNAQQTDKRRNQKNIGIVYAIPTAAVLPESLAGINSKNPVDN